ncbi:hypothetical protein H0H81_009122 [Sphagnurus paluster]|uniref:Uncharacterized protein n=1 Tax=Sphagnurus paluster TaxID=117069 RepID=A0A9P7FVZ6_9AGAR|nr:hypothetical protein H0H81_009122 [Sphagnurus paluster]
MLSLAESKKDLAQKTVDLQARDPNDDLLLKIRDLKAQNVALKSNLRDLQQKHGLRQKSSQDVELQARTKLQEAEKSNIELLCSNKQLQASLMEMQTGAKINLEEVKKLASGQCQTLENELERTRVDTKQAYDRLLDETSELKERLSMQSVSLFQCKDECATLKEHLNSATNQLNAAQDLLVVSQEKCALAAEAIAAHAQAEVADLKARFTTLNGKLFSRKTTNQAQQEVKRLELLVVDLQQNNNELVETAKSSLSQPQHMIDALKAKIHELQMTVARLHKGGQPVVMNRPMVGLKTWLGSSLDNKEFDGQMEYAIGRNDHKEASIDHPMAPASISDSSRPSAPAKTVDSKFHQTHDPDDDCEASSALSQILKDDTDERRVGKCPRLPSVAERPTRRTASLLTFLHLPC